MTAIICRPKAITYQASSTLTSAEPKNLSNDIPGMTWRSSGLSGVFSTFRTDGTAIDTIALVATNLRASDSVRIRFGSSVIDVISAPVFDQTFSAWSGLAPISEATCVFTLAAPVTQDFIRIDITSPGNPAGYVEVSRLVVGLRIEFDGINYGHEEVFDDTSTIEDANGAVTIDTYAIRQQHKIEIAHIKADAYLSKWRPFLSAVGMSKFFLYVEELGGPFNQHKTHFVRNVAAPKRINLAYDQETVELTVGTWK